VKAEAQRAAQSHSTTGFFTRLKARAAYRH
jgi:hypothetical protein